MQLISEAFPLPYSGNRNEKGSWEPCPILSLKSHECFSFFPHTEIILTLFTWHQVEIKRWTKFSIKTGVSQYATAGIEAEYHFVPWFLLYHDLFARYVFIWKLRFVCLLDQDASLCHLCCHHNSFATTFLWNHLENRRWWRNNSLLSKTHCWKFMYIYFGISAAVWEKLNVLLWFRSYLCKRSFF